MKSKTLSLKTIINELDFLKNQLEFSEKLDYKDLLLLANKLTKNIPDPRNAKEHFQSLIIKKNRKSVKQSEITTYKPKTLQILSIVDIKSVITEHPKTSHKLSKTIRKSEKVDSNSSLYSDTKKRGNFLNEKNIKITKQAHAFTGYASFYNVGI